jgi:multiple antibiotic resistance protein
MMQDFLLAFIPLLVAIDVLGTLPLFMSLTENLSAERRQRLTRQAVMTAFAVGMLFLFAGRAIFSVLGITDNDFRIAGGLLLVIIAVTDLLTSTEKEPGRDPGSHVGVVPIGIPLIMGPAALTTLLILQEQQGVGLTLASLFANLLIVWIAYAKASWIQKIMGASGSKAFAKVAALFLAAIGVMMIRVGIQNVIQHP